MKRLAAYGSSLLLVAAMLLGGIAGAIWGPGAVALRPIAELFLNLLYCGVVPLVFCSLTAAIARTSDLVKLGRILGLFIGLLVLTGVISCLLMFAAVLLLDPSKGAQVDLSRHVGRLDGSADVLGMFTVPDLFSLFSKSNLMALIVFAMLFSVSIILARDRGKPVLAFMTSMAAVSEKLIGLIMGLAPLGLGCYFCMLIGEHGSQLAGPLARCVIIFTAVTVLYFFASQTVYALLAAGWRGVRAWWASCIPPTLTALGTCSSAAALPANLAQAKQLGVPEDIADLVITTGLSLHKDGSCLTQMMKIGFLFGVFGMVLATPEHLAVAIVVSLIASVVEGGIPEGGYVSEVIIASAFGFPPVTIPMMALIGTITDSVATAVNATGDTGLAMIAARVIEGRDWFDRVRTEECAEAETAKLPV